MIETLPDRALLLYRRAVKQPLVPSEQRDGPPRLARQAIEALIPHRHPFLFIDRVTLVDRTNGVIAGRYNLAQSHELLQGHFPNRPVWPGVLQVEAVGQLGSLLCSLEVVGDHGRRAPPLVTATHISGARFLRPVIPGGDLEILGVGIRDGLFYTVVGQCLQDQRVCSVVCTSILVEEACT